ncbi:hypothetical protein Acor_21440 [Acrocarpospora corrugata]|uniref:Uncharacterized protein n=1 Tax=Acrocarpospora corrugata TaxID=35763 RepID=A0A5M3VZ26_9ACTN|nr:hypothetical protein [Acrocarpospora corrugata]GES00081.1 hypothetical protein Acor_21440 [Acrocarpospora corrugata]
MDKSVVELLGGPNEKSLLELLDGRNVKSVVESSPKPAVTSLDGPMDKSVVELLGGPIEKSLLELLDGRNVKSLVESLGIPGVNLSGGDSGMTSKSSSQGVVGQPFGRRRAMGGPLALGGWGPG